MKSNLKLYIKQMKNKFQLNMDVLDLKIVIDFYQVA